MSENLDRLQQLITDHDDAWHAFLAAMDALSQEEAKANPDPVRVEQLQRRIASLQSQIGEIENAPEFEEPPA